MNEWKISDWKPIRKNTLIGTFTVDARVLRIKGCMLHQKGEKKWINLPSREYFIGSQRRFASVIEFKDRDAYCRFQDWCLVELDRIITPTQKEPEPVTEIEQDCTPF